MKKIVAVDFYDLIWKQEHIFSREDMDLLFRNYKAHGVETVLWRLSVFGMLLYRSSTPDRYHLTDDELGQKTVELQLGQKTVELLRQYDPAAEAVNAAHRYGIEILFWVTLYDDTALPYHPKESEFCRLHPEFCWRSKDGKQYFRGILSYAHPETVEFRMTQLREIAAYGGDGLYLCNRTHSFPPCVWERMYKEAGTDDSEKQRQWFLAHKKEARAEFTAGTGKFGFDAPALAAFKGNVDDEKEWQNFRGAYLTRFLEKVRREIPGKLWFGLRYANDAAGIFYPYGNYFFDWEKFSAGTITDALAYNLQPPHFDLPEHYPEFYRPTKSKKFLWLGLADEKPLELIEAYRESVERWTPYLDGIIAFEAYQLNLHKEYWTYLDRL